MATVRHIDDSPQRRRREARAVERAFLAALERGDTTSDQLVRRLMAALRGERPDRVR